MIRSPWQRVALTPPLPHLLGCGDPDQLLCRPGADVRINGMELDAVERDLLSVIEMTVGFRLMTGDYWYDHRSGAFGRVGLPTAGFLPAELGFSGALDARCSGGGTGYFVNGRELHDVDRRWLERRLCAFEPGRYVLDPDGSFGLEGEAPRWNLRASDEPIAA